MIKPEKLLLSSFFKIFMGGVSSSSEMVVSLGIRVLSRYEVPLLYVKTNLFPIASLPGQ